MSVEYGNVTDIRITKASDLITFTKGLAPKHKYPGPLEECVKAFNYLTNDLGVSPSKVIFSGDSAGGALVLETLMGTYAPSILDNLDCSRENYSIPLPAGALLSSPLVSAETSSESWKKYAKTDIVSPKLATLIFKEYLDLPKVEVEDLPILRLAHVRKEFDRFMPKKVMVFVGEKEVLRDDILDMVDAIKVDGKIDIQLIQEKYAHDWFMIHEIVKKKDKDMIAKYDELFVDFAVEAVEEGKRSLQQQRPLATISESVSSKNTLAITETIDMDQAVITDEKKGSSIVLAVKTNDNETENNRVLPVFSSGIDKNISTITAKLDEPFELFEKTEFPKPAQYKPNTILSEYAIITDSPSKNTISV
jgi:acetyl esterase/lipase